MWQNVSQRITRPYIDVTNDAMNVTKAKQSVSHHSAHVLVSIRRFGELLLNTGKKISQRVSQPLGFKQWRRYTVSRQVI